MKGPLARLATAFLSVAVLGAGVLLALLPSDTDPRARSVASFENDGLRVLYLTLERLGFPVAPWHRAPGELSGPGTLLVQAQRPTAAENKSSRRYERDLAQYRRFVEEGGVVLFLDVGTSTLAFVKSHLGGPGLDELAFQEVRDEGEEEQPDASESLPSAGPSRARLFVGDEELACASRGHFEGEGFRTLVRDVEREPVGVEVQLGAGRIILLAVGAQRFSNENLRERRDYGVLCVRLLENLRPFERVLFDEYVLGAWRPPSPFALAFSPRLAWFSVHVLLCCVFLVWRGAWAGPFARDPAPLRAASPLARARGHARLLARHGRFDLLGRLLRAAWLERRGVRGMDSAEEQALPSEWKHLVRGDSQLAERLRSLFGREPRTEAELATFARELAALDLTLGTAPRARGPGPAVPTRSAVP
jgi:hypothetical protein